MKRTYFRMHDKNPTSRIELEFDQGEHWNKQGWGIFWSINEFDCSGTWREENIVRINSWACDLDKTRKNLKKTYTKDDLLKAIHRCSAYPSLIVETKNGFHLYWYSADGTVENYRRIQAGILEAIPEGDPCLKDCSRILRVPGFYHCKDPNNLFLVTQIGGSGRIYSEAYMLNQFPSKAEEKKSLCNETDYLPSREALELLSETKYVNYDKFTFKKNTNGTHQIQVNGRSTGAWIDDNNLIGSNNHGGPTIKQWLRWYNLGKRNIHEALMFLEECFDQKMVEETK